MDGTDAIKELRQIIHEILDGAAATSSKWVANTFHGWQATIWVMDPTVNPSVIAHDGETLIPKLSLTFGHITARFELINKDLKILVDAPGFTASRPENLSEPNSIYHLSCWLRDAITFALRDIEFPA